MVLFLIFSLLDYNGKFLKFFLGVISSAETEMLREFRQRNGLTSHDHEKALGDIGFKEEWYDFSFLNLLLLSFF